MPKYEYDVNPGGQRIRRLAAAATSTTAATDTSGTIPEVLDAVGDDPERARGALAAERRGAKRSTLIAKLEAIRDAE